MRTISTIARKIDEIIESLEEPEYAIYGFDFVPDDNTFDPYTIEAMNAAGYPHDVAAPIVDGFLYISDEYQAFLQSLEEANQIHPYKRHRNEQIID